MKKIAVFDIDGVLADFEGHLVERLSQKWGNSVFTGRGEYALANRYDGETLVDAQVIASDPVAYRVLNADMAAVEMVNESLDRGYGVLFLTSRGENLKTVTEMWLRKTLGEYAFSKCLGIQHSLQKTAYLFDSRGEVAFVVEDNPDDIAEMKKIGLPVFAWEQPWNSAIFPKLWVDRENNIQAQESDASDSEYFWNYIGEKDGQQIN